MTETRTDQIYDLVIIGGGVNGCGIARDATGRGATVALFEQGDLAGATSSASTKLIHGGLRYLEHYEFRLVREALTEREVVWRMAPHIVWPLRFVLPHHDGLRPWWLLRLGLFLYDNLGGRKLLPATRSLDLTTDAAGKDLSQQFRRAFEYSDCWVEDSRLVVLNARDAAERGARIETRTRVVSAARENGRWAVRVRREDGREETVFSRALVNAGGPWVADVLNGVVRSNSGAGVRMVQGSHIVVRRLFEHDRCYIFQNADGRIIFAIPYERDFTLIGTTDVDYKGDPRQVAASEDEIAYLCAAVSEYVRTPVRREDVVWTYSGVRPLYDDGASKAQEATRDYVLTLDAADDGTAPLLSVFGGKITTFRRLAESALAKLTPHLAVLDKPSWTGTAALPGGDFPPDGYDALVAAIGTDHPWIERSLLRRLVRAYGTDTRRILAGCTRAEDLGQSFGADLFEREIRWLMEREWAVGADDVVWRRTKLGLRLTPEQRTALDGYMAQAKVVAEPVT